MNLFSGIRKKQTIVKFGMQPIDQEVLDRITNYAEHLPLLISSGRIHVQLMEELEKGAGRVPYYLLFFTDGTEEGYLNAGYASGMTSYFLRFQGIAASVLRESPMRIHKTEYMGMRCTAALAFGYEPKGRDAHKRNVRETEAPCILKEQRDHWEDEVLNFAKEHFEAIMSSVQVIRQDRWIHFMKKTTPRKNAQTTMFEAGAAIAGIMAAAEDLWIDLALVNVQDLLSVEAKVSGEIIQGRRVINGPVLGGRVSLENPFESPEYLISVCRRKECRGAALLLLRKYSISAELITDVPEESLWRYA